MISTTTTAQIKKTVLSDFFGFYLIFGFSHLFYWVVDCSWSWMNSFTMLFTSVFTMLQNHNLSRRYNFHSHLIQSMEEEFQRIVGVSGPLWGFVVAFMLFNIKEYK